MVGCAEAVLEAAGAAVPHACCCAPATWASRARKTYDLEVWLPGQGTLPRDQLLLELRRLPGPADGRALPRRPGEKGTRFVHTLNGSGLAVGRTLVAVMENYQDEGGRIAIPQALQPYMGGLTHIGGAA